MKNKGTQIGLALAILLVLANRALAGGGFDVAVPDGGSSALLLGLAVVGVGAARRLLSKG